MAETKPINDVAAMSTEELNVELERLLFRDDLTANTADYLADAVIAWVPKATRLSWDVILRGSMSASESCCLWAWNNRQGQAWQHDLEQHVAAYRRKPRDLAGSADGFMLVESAMHARGYRFCAKHDSDGFYVNYVNIDKEVLSEWEQVNGLPDCNARAALLALRFESNRDGESVHPGRSGV